MKKIILSALAIIGLNVQAQIAELTMEQAAVNEWKQLMHEKVFQEKLDEKDIPLPSYINKAPKNVNKISAADFRKREGQDFPIDTVKYSGPDAITMVLVGDGFTSTQYDSFKNYANEMVNYMFRQIPYNYYKEWFNVLFIKVDSKESGTSHPGNGQGVCPEGSSLPISHYDTYFGVELDAFGIHRLPCVTNNKIYELLDALVPGYDIAGVLANTQEYGGSGGDILVTTVNSASNEIFMHELGHTFGKLADEYYAGDGYLHECANTSSHNTAETVPWKAWWGVSQVGAFPIGGSALGNKYYKPVNGTCKMEYLNKQFCPPCRENIIKMIHAKTKMIKTYLPNAVTVKPAFEDETVDFEVDYFDVPRKITVQWLLDGEELAKDKGLKKYTLNVSGFEVNERHTLEAKVADENAFLAEPISESKKWYVRRLESTGIDIVNVEKPSATTVNKFVKDGRIYIVKEGKTFNLGGQEIQ